MAQRQQLADGGDSGGLPAADAAGQHYDATMAAEVNAMLAQTLGAGKAQVVVNADVDANQATSQSLVYAKKGVPLTQQKTTEALKGAGAANAGGSGTSANIPAYSATSGSGGGGNSNYKNQTVNTTFGVGKTITHSVIAPGRDQAPERLGAGRQDRARRRRSRRSARRSSNAVGLQPKRGDALSISQLAFAPTKAAPVAAGPASSMLKYAKYGILALGSLLFLGFVGRLLRKREREPFAGQPTWLRELEAPRSLAALEQSQPTEVAALQPAVNVARRQVEDLVARDPERVASAGARLDGRGLAGSRSPMAVELYQPERAGSRARAVQAAAALDQGPAQGRGAAGHARRRARRPGVLTAARGRDRDAVAGDGQPAVPGAGPGRRRARRAGGDGRGV